VVIGETPSKRRRKRNIDLSSQTTGLRRVAISRRYAAGKKKKKKRRRKREKKKNVFAGARTGGLRRPAKNFRRFAAGIERMGGGGAGE